MRNIIVILLLLGLPVVVHARTGTWGSDIEVQRHSIDGDSTLGINLDPDNDGINEATIDTLGAIQFGNVTSDPCSVAKTGMLFWNNTAKEMCVCDGTNDVRVKDASTACF